VGSSSCTIRFYIAISIPASMRRGYTHHEDGVGDVGNEVVEVRRDDERRIVLTIRDHRRLQHVLRCARLEIGRRMKKNDVLPPEYHIGVSACVLLS
jgi:hypothetical protein